MSKLKAEYSSLISSELKIYSTFGRDISIQIKFSSTTISKFPAKVSAIYFPKSIIFRFLKVEKTEIVA